ncbi:MAG: hypothetical protein EAY68_08070 [Bacteroidetes bacterium]|nr:MAG: hypothetical protein EAY68_08070 [Bacteroidota bacterium]
MYCEALAKVAFAPTGWLNTDQVPVPIAGKFPVIAVLVPQIVWSFPAIATLGCAVLVMTSVLSEGGQFPLLTLHLNTLFPTPKLITEALFAFGFNIVPAPLTKVQVPVPMAGSVALKVVASVQIV